MILYTQVVWGGLGLRFVNRNFDLCVKIKMVWKNYKDFYLTYMFYFKC